MIRYIKAFIPLLVIIFSQISCEKDPSVEGFVNLMPEYEIYIHQKLTEFGGQPTFLVKSLSLAECENATLTYEVSNINNILKIRLDNIVQESACIGGPTTISETIELGDDVGDRSVSISLRDIVQNPGIIRVGAEKIQLELESNHGIKISKSSINRIQKNMMWGHFESDNQATISAVEEIIEKHRSTPSVNTGDYGFFYIDLSNNAYIKLDDETTAEGFVFRSEVSLETLQTELLDIKSEDDSFTFDLTTFQGRTLVI